jgi:hypothetical protein
MVWYLSTGTILPLLSFEKKKIKISIKSANLSSIRPQKLSYKSICYIQEYYEKAKVLCFFQFWISLLRHVMNKLSKLMLLYGLMAEAACLFWTHPTMYCLKLYVASVSWFLFINATTENVCFRTPDLFTAQRDLGTTVRYSNASVDMEIVC